MTLNFIDSFEDAGSLYKGFIRAGYTPLAHIEMDKYACNTLKTRAAFRWWKTNDQLQEYKKYLYEKQEKEDESKLCSQVSPEVIDSVILYEIGEKNTSNFWKKIPIQNVCI